MVTRPQNGIRSNRHVVAQDDPSAETCVDIDIGVQCNPVSDLNRPVIAGHERAIPKATEFISDNDIAGADKVDSPANERVRAHSVYPPAEVGPAGLETHGTGHRTEKEVDILDELGPEPGDD